MINRADILAVPALKRTEDIRQSVRDAPNGLLLEFGVYSGASFLLIAEVVDPRKLYRNGVIITSAFRFL